MSAMTRTMRCMVTVGGSEAIDMAYARHARIRETRC